MRFLLFFRGFFRGFFRRFLEFEIKTFFIPVIRRDFVLKVMRCFIVVLSFLCLTYAWGMEPRESQQFFYLLGGMLLFGLLLDNIWISLFLWWSVFLYAFFKFSIGHSYIINIFLGCVLYYITKVSFKKKDVDFFINAVLWLAVINIFYMAIQTRHLDWMFKARIDTLDGFLGYQAHNISSGFMGFRASMGMVMAFCVPLLVSRTRKFSVFCGLLLLWPVWISESSICVLGAVVGLLFVLWYKLMPLMKKVQRWAVFGLISVLLMGGAFFYAFKVDATPTSVELRLVAWSGILEDTIIHPVTGWGLDSFRKVTEKKKHIYAMNPTKTPKGNIHLELLDNPHNLYISLMYEWGILGLILLGGYLRQCGLWFQKAIKEPNTIALAGFGVVLLIVSIAQFPMFLARMCVIIIPMAGLYEIQTRT